MTEFYRMYCRCAPILYFICPLLYVHFIFFLLFVFIIFYVAVFLLIFYSVCKWILCSYPVALTEKHNKRIYIYIYINISLPHYRMPRKTVKFVPVVPKAHGRANVCARRKSIKQCNFRKCFGGFL